MQVNKTKFEDAWIIIPDRYEDNRGWFSESYGENKIESFLEICNKFNFTQDYQSMSIYPKTIRGLHYQEAPFERTKLVQCVNGAIFDVIVDIRQESKTFLQWESFILSEENGYQLLVPTGFAHGFFTLKAYTKVFYKMDSLYSTDHYRGISWNDPILNINWPDKENVIISDKDSKLPTIKELFK